ncbi:MAG: hypothetical protein ABIH69_00915 [bacterium]|nr:hypothetical protein [Candidatus Margulisiibacteriota bacterium]
MRSLLFADLDLHFELNNNQPAQKGFDGELLELFDVMINNIAKVFVPGPMDDPLFGEALPREASSSLYKIEFDKN